MTPGVELRTFAALRGGRSRVQPRFTNRLVTGHANAVGTGVQPAQRLLDAGDLLRGLGLERRDYGNLAELGCLLGGILLERIAGVGVDRADAALQFGFQVQQALADRLGFTVVLFHVMPRYRPVCEQA